jgi:hypothetical protein
MKPAKTGSVGALRRPYQTAQKKSRIGVLIADDHSVVREGLASLIRRKQRPRSGRSLETTSA